MMARLFGLLAAAALVLSALNAQAAVFSVTSAGSTFNVDPFVTTDTSAGFYSLGSPVGASANTPVPIAQSNAVVMFLLDSSTSGTGGISIGTIVDAITDGSAGTLSMQLINLLGSPTLAVSDDPNEAALNGSSLIADFTWFVCCTDGFLVDGLPATSLDVQYSITASTGIDEILFATPDGMGGVNFTEIGLTGTINGIIPLPASVWLLLGAVGALATFRQCTRRIARRARATAPRDTAA